MPKQQVNGIELYYEITGQGPALLLIHGLGSSGRDWELQLPEFSRHFRIITFDVRGHGRSEKAPGSYSIPMFAQDTAELIRALQIGPAHVVGISMGGMIAFQLAISVPELVRSMVIVNSWPELPMRGLRDWIGGMQRLLIVQLFGMRKMGQVLSQRLLPGPQHTALREEFVKRWAENDPRAYRRSMRALMGWSVADEIASITCPTLVIASDQDYSSVASKQAYVERMPHAELAVIRDAHHAVPVEHPEEFNILVMEFLLRRI